MQFIHELTDLLDQFGFNTNTREILGIPIPVFDKTYYNDVRIFIGPDVDETIIMTICSRNEEIVIMLNGLNELDHLLIKIGNEPDLENLYDRSVAQEFI